MIPYWFEGANYLIEAPRDHDHASVGEVIGLPIEITDIDGGARILKSAWKPTPEQLAVLVRGGAVTCESYNLQPIMRIGVIEADKLKVPA